jgi:DNA repair exonuclease SbcCD ATPase subunit
VGEPAEVHIDESVSTELGERVRAIVAAAESMANAMKEDAEQYAAARRREVDEETERRLRDAREQADRMVQERVTRMSELSDSIVARSESVLERLGQTEEVRRQLDELVHSLGHAAQQLGGELAEGDQVADQVSPMPPPGEARPALRPVESPNEPGDRDEHLENARLVALQMAVAGRSREEVAAHLREEFRIEDPGPILERIYSEDLPRSERR